MANLIKNLDFNNIRNKVDFVIRFQKKQDLVRPFSILFYFLFPKNVFKKNWIWLKSWVLP